MEPDQMCQAAPCAPSPIAQPRIVPQQRFRSTLHRARPWRLRGVQHCCQEFLGKDQCTRAFEKDCHFLTPGFVRGAYESGGIWSGSGPNNTGHTLWAYATVDGSG